MRLHCLNQQQNVTNLNKTMSKQNEQHIENVQKCYDAVKECANLGAALATLTDTIFAIVEVHMEKKTDRALIMGACIKRLREYKKEFEK